MTFQAIVITDWKNRITTYPCYTIEQYHQYLAENPCLCELIGRSAQQIKPVFDVDAYENDIDINQVIADIQKVFPNKTINHAKRQPREYKEKGIKFSYRFYVKGVRISSKNLKTLLFQHQFDKNKIYDMSI